MKIASKIVILALLVCFFPAAYAVEKNAISDYQTMPTSEGVIQRLDLNEASPGIKSIAIEAIVAKRRPSSPKREAESAAAEQDESDTTEQGVPE